MVEYNIIKSVFDEILSNDYVVKCGYIVTNQSNGATRDTSLNKWEVRKQLEGYSQDEKHKLLEEKYLNPLELDHYDTLQMIHDHLTEELTKPDLYDYVREGYLHRLSLKRMFCNEIFKTCLFKSFVDII